MKQLEVTKRVTYRWWRGDKKDIAPEHVPALEERAAERIAEMTAQGYIGGELNDNIHMTADDPQDGVEYSGWWEITDPSNNP